MLSILGTEEITVKPNDFAKRLEALFSSPQFPFPPNAFTVLPFGLIIAFIRKNINSIRYPSECFGLQWLLESLRRNLKGYAFDAAVAACSPDEENCGAALGIVVTADDFIVCTGQIGLCLTVSHV